MLDVGQDGVLVLDAADAGRAQDAAEHRVLAEVLRRAAGERRAAAGHARRQDHVLAQVERLGALVGVLGVGQVGVQVEASEMPAGKAVAPAVRTPSGPSV